VNGGLTEFSIPTESSGPIFIAVGGDGNLWFTELLSNQIGEFIDDGDQRAVPVPPGPAHTSTQASVTAIDATFSPDHSAPTDVPPIAGYTERGRNSTPYVLTSRAENRRVGLE